MRWLERNEVEERQKEMEKSKSKFFLKTKKEKKMKRKGSFDLHSDLGFECIWRETISAKELASGETGFPFKVESFEATTVGVGVDAGPVAEIVDKLPFVGVSLVEAEDAKSMEAIFLEGTSVMENTGFERPVSVEHARGKLSLVNIAVGKVKDPRPFELSVAVETVINITIGINVEPFAISLALGVLTDVLVPVGVHLGDDLRRLRGGSGVGGESGVDGESGVGGSRLVALVSSEARNQRQRGGGV